MLLELLMAEPYRLRAHHRRRNACEVIIAPYWLPGKKILRDADWSHSRNGIKDSNVQRNC